MEDRNERPIEEKLKDKLEELDKLDEEELVRLWNEFCYAKGWTEDLIFEMATLDEHCEGLTYTEVLKDVQKTNFNIYHKYFKYVEDGIESSNFPAFDWIDEDYLVNYIIENEDSLGNSAIREILESDVNKDGKDH